jgi:amino acid permease
MFSILNEIKDNRPTRTTGVVTGSIGTAASIYVLVAITGYLSFGDNVVGNIVSQYTPSVTSTIGRAAIVVLVMFSYPLQVHPVPRQRRCCIKMATDRPQKPRAHTIRRKP